MAALEREPVCLDAPDGDAVRRRPKVKDGVPVGTEPLARSGRSAGVGLEGTSRGADDGELLVVRLPIGGGECLRHHAWTASASRDVVGLPGAGDLSRPGGQTHCQYFGGVDIL